MTRELKVLRDFCLIVILPTEMSKRRLSMSSSESDSRSRSLQNHSPASHDSGDHPVFYEWATFKTFEDFQTKSYQDSFNQPLVELKDCVVHQNHLVLDRGVRRTGWRRCHLRTGATSI